MEICNWEKVEVEEKDGAVWVLIPRDTKDISKRGIKDQGESLKRKREFQSADRLTSS